MNRLGERIETLRLGGIRLRADVSLEDIRSSISGFVQFGVVTWAGLLNHLSGEFTDDLFSQEIEDEPSYSALVTGLARLAGQEGRIGQVRERRVGDELEVTFRWEGDGLRFAVPADHDWIDFDALGEMARTFETPERVFAVMNDSEWLHFAYVSRVQLEVLEQLPAAGGAFTRLTE